MQRSLTGDHDNADPGGPAQLDGAHHLLTRGVEHTDTAHKGQVGLNKKGKQSFSDLSSYLKKNKPNNNNA